MSKYWSKIVQNIEPYTPGEQPRDKRYIKLNTNENPYPPSPRVMAAIKNAADETLRLYPDPTCRELRSVVGRYYNVHEDQVFVGNGSDELLAFAFQAFFNPGKPILFPDISYSFYPVYAQLYNIHHELVPLEDDFSIPVEMFFKDNGGVIFPNPNAPTAKAISEQAVASILKHNMDRVVIVDEAYIDFGGESVVKLIKEFPNLLVIQTLSKSRSLAGLRIGLAFGHADLIEGLNRIKNSFNSYTVDRLALAGAAAAVEDDVYFRETTSKIIKTRDHVAGQMRELGFTVTDSKANFIFVSHPEYYAGTLYQQLRSRGILVRYFNRPRIDNFLRVSIGTDQEMNLFVKAVKEILSGV
ncbi:MAG: histidinol-phosphate transaminase [Clostridiales bacterium]|nr:histidinol-phosphate transaminase [Eubacteriales bacterium]MDH7567071.1 histidinol-phosphate transaminase [Clostridiales bacterium]